jgi:hypothetical protein
MSGGEIESGDGDEGGTGTLPRTRTGSLTIATGAETHKLTYQVILRHLAKFREGAQAVFGLLDRHTPEEAAPARTGPAPARTGPAPAPFEPQPESPLELRIERHMAGVDQALFQIKALNPDRQKEAELPPNIRDQIVTKKRTIHDIVGAELHFWAAAIENAPLDKFDEIEQRWIERIIRLADILGVDAEHQEHLVFLKDWVAKRHP